MGKHSWPVSFDVVIEPDAGARLGQDGSGAWPCGLRAGRSRPDLCRICGTQNYSGIMLVNGGARMALSLREVRRDPIANRALRELMHHYTVAEEKSRLVLTKKAGDMKLFLHDLDDLHQLDFIHNQQMVKEIERLRVLPAAGELEGPCLDGRGAVARSDCQNQQQ